MAVEGGEAGGSQVWTSSVDQTIKIWKAKVRTTRVFPHHQWWSHVYLQIGGKNDSSSGRIRRGDLLDEVPATDCLWRWTDAVITIY
jgi:hypothetical protein